jgi:small-conductance mechanosensitive channel
MIPNLLHDAQGNIVFTPLIGRIGLALLYMVIGAICAWIIPPLVQRSVLAWAEMRIGTMMTERRQNTIARLMLTLTRAAIIAITTVAVLSLFVNSAGLFAFLGLFTAAMGFSLRQSISDYISGFIFLFEDLYAIGDEVQLAGERGTVEDLSLRTTTLRAPTGDMRVVPHADIRTVYNYARAPFSRVTVNIQVHASDLEKAYAVLDAMVKRLPMQMPALDGVPQIFVASDTLGSEQTMTIQTRVRPDDDLEVKRQLITAISHTLADNEIVAVGDANG